MYDCRSFCMLHLGLPQIPSGAKQLISFCCLYINPLSGAEVKNGTRVGLCAPTQSERKKTAHVCRQTASSNMPAPADRLFGDVPFFGAKTAGPRFLCRCARAEASPFFTSPTTMLAQKRVFFLCLSANPFLLPANFLAPCLFPVPSQKRFSGLTSIIQMLFVVPSAVSFDRHRQSTCWTVQS